MVDETQKRLNAIQAVVWLRMKKYHEPIVKNYGFGTGIESKLFPFAIMLFWIVIVITGTIVVPIL